jgi:hypothetical protein
MRACDKLRTVHLSPYRKGAGPTFTLTTFDTGDPGNGHYRLAYRLTMREAGVTTVLFEGNDFGCSPLHAIDSDDTIAALMSFLTLRPGDTDADYFDSYTDVQRAYCDQHAEALAWTVLERFGER